MTMTIAAENGFEVSKSYRVKEGVDEDCYNGGMVVKFLIDDNSAMPQFEILEGEVRSLKKGDKIYVDIFDLEPISVTDIKEKQMSNKTEVQITIATKEDTHNIGDYYKLDDDLYVLANVQEKAVLVCLNDGRFYAEPYEYESVGVLYNYEFAKCRGNNGDFVKVQKVKISIE